MIWMTRKKKKKRSKQRKISGTMEEKRNVKKVKIK